MITLKYIIIPIIVVIISQLLKVIIYAIKNKKISITKFFNGMGGMPSSHAALVSSISTLTFVTSGGDSLIFGICFIFSLIVIYDAMGIRYESGLHAKEINKVINTNLTESLGHTPFEVLGGIFLGIIVTLLLN